MRNLLLLFLLQTAFLFLPFSVLANKDFRTEVIVTYIYDSSGKCRVEKQFTVTNLTSDQMISSYELYFSGPIPADLQGYDQGGKLNFQSEPSDGGTKVRIFFNTIAAGKNEKLTFNIQFSGTSASKIDNRWEIRLPKTDTLEQIDKSMLKLIVPDTFGNLHYSSYTPDLIDTYGVLKNYTYDNFISKSEDIFLIFSLDNVIGFRIEYDLTRQEAINLPSDTLSQKILFKSISPQPENIFSSEQGHWQSQFPPSQKYPLKVLLSGQVQFASSSPEFNKYPFGVNPSVLDYFPEPYILPKTGLSLFLKIPWQFLPLYTQSIELIISNNGNAAAYDISLSLSAPGINLRIDTDKIKVIPPGGHISIPVYLEFPLSSIFQHKYFLITAGDLVMTYNIPVSHLLIFYGLPTFIVAGLFISFAFIAHHAWSLHLQKSTGKSNLHRKSK